MLSTIKDINNVIFDGLDSINPLITNFDADNEEIATLLLDNGYSVKRIQKFIDVSRTKFDEWAEFEVKVRERMAEAKAVMQAASGSKTA